MKESAFFWALLWALLALTSAQRCEDAEQQRMQGEFTNCINNYTNIHHDAMGKAETEEEYQTITCQILRDTVKCGNVWSRCYQSKEVRSMKDAYIKARMDQLTADRQDVSQCDVVKEYLESGRAAQQEKDDLGAQCSHDEVNLVQRNFQNCSYTHSGNVWTKIQELKDAKMMELRRENLKNGNTEIDESRLLNVNRDVKPHICKAIHKIGSKCTEGFSKCYSEEDGKLLKNQHLQQLKDYFSGMYSGLDLSSCPRIDQNEEEEEEEEDENRLIRFGEDELDYPEETNDINGPSEAFPTTTIRTTTSTTTRRTTTTTTTTTTWRRTTTITTTDNWSVWFNKDEDTTMSPYISDELGEDYNVGTNGNRDRLGEDEEDVDRNDKVMDFTDKNSLVVNDKGDDDEEEEEKGVDNGYHAGEQKSGVSKNLIGTFFWIVIGIQVRLILWH